MRNLPIIVLLSCLCNISVAQTEVPINQKLKNVTIVEFKPPYNKIEVMVEKNKRYNFLEITDRSVYQRDRKSTAPLSDLKQGMRVVLTIDYFQKSNRAEIKKVELDSDYYGSTSVEGIFEDLKDDVAYIDGQAVKLMANKKIRGLDGWKGKTFGSFNEMQLGALVKIRGKREIEGHILAESGTVTPVISNEVEIQLRRASGMAFKVTKTDIIIGVKKLPLVTDIKLQDYINRIGMSLVPKYMQELPIDHPDKIDFKFFIVNDEEANAYAFPDGITVVHTGLLKTIENEAQLAAVLGHEITHLLYGHHAAKTIQTGKWKNLAPVIGVGTAFATGSADAGIVVALMTEIAGDISKQSYSRKKENQADRVGLYYMSNAGYDPREGMKFWRNKFVREQEKKEDLAAKSQSMDLALGLTGPSIEDSDNNDTENAEKETKSTYDPSHPKVKERFDNMNYLLATAYVNVDYNKLGEESVGRINYKTSVLDKIKIVKPAPKPKTPKPKSTKKS
ncbi:M48 family metalloprotease [Runella sp.]|uniref:M48 family metalloprotease n=1 Tax=Runella sp. TaxID=1960881 RepID=UPI003017547C